MFGFLASLLSHLLGTLGLSPQRKAKIIFLGLDNAGNTTLLRVLKDDRVTINPPTLYPNAEELVIGKIRFRTFDLGGHETARRIWRDYFTEVDGILFIVDGADPSRFAEAREELAQLLAEPCLASVPVCVLGNKIDIPTAVSEDELRHALQIGAHVRKVTGRSELSGGSRPVGTLHVLRGEANGLRRWLQVDREFHELRRRSLPLGWFDVGFLFLMLGFLRLISRV